MSRNLFFIIASVISFAFGATMFVSPGLLASAFTLIQSDATDVLFRALSAAILALGVLNFLVRNHADSETLKAVLWANITVHGISLVAEVISVSGGYQLFSGVAAGVVLHLFIGVGSYIYLRRMEPV